MKGLEGVMGMLVLVASGRSREGLFGGRVAQEIRSRCDALGQQVNDAECFHMACAGELCDWRELRQRPSSNRALPVAAALSMLRWQRLRFVKRAWWKMGREIGVERDGSFTCVRKRSSWPRVRAWASEKKGTSLVSVLLMKSLHRKAYLMDALLASKCPNGGPLSGMRISLFDLHSRRLPERLLIAGASSVSIVETAQNEAQKAKKRLTLCLLNVRYITPQPVVAVFLNAFIVRCDKCIGI
ncbi:unnamed protein product [Gongylonema pulchrum]|uniref:Secreted protein n=1 Tax=Gongylonema pulchrum TaxID=637853 RepID=A0A183E2M9_9BILA|nr:unnamed protein product [Gongylonema pulchrum]